MSQSIPWWVERPHSWSQKCCECGTTMRERKTQAVFSPLIKFHTVAIKQITLNSKGIFFSSIFFYLIYFLIWNQFDQNAVIILIQSLRKIPTKTRLRRLYLQTNTYIHLTELFGIRLFNIPPPSPPHTHTITRSTFTQQHDRLSNTLTISDEILTCSIFIFVSLSMQGPHQSVLQFWIIFYTISLRISSSLSSLL